ncbi:hypothetical protein [Planctomycetes bacterium K23_9]|uniref:Uncharacterized protein n=1 Tax=Stieleria marina TaxID=1930275 RepID=A0A517NVC9_9BACT|nr:hypothetical protein K239x_30600 [Planctomycetes bacterium K23_9]
MKRFKGLWRDTWWLWAFFAVMVLGISAMISWFFLFVWLTLPVSFFYFAFIRYDEEGNEKPEA